MASGVNTQDLETWFAQEQGACNPSFAPSIGYCIVLHLCISNALSMLTPTEPVHWYLMIKETPIVTGLIVRVQTIGMLPRSLATLVTACLSHRIATKLQRLEIV